MNGVSWCLLACVVVAVRRLFIVYFNIYIPFIIKHTRVLHKPKAFNSFSDGCNKCYEFLRIFMV